MKKMNIICSIKQTKEIKNSYGNLIQNGICINPQETKSLLTKDHQNMIIYSSRKRVYTNV